MFFVVSCRITLASVVIIIASRGRISSILFILSRAQLITTTILVTVWNDAFAIRGSHGGGCLNGATDGAFRFCGNGGVLVVRGGGRRQIIVVVIIVIVIVVVWREG
jgi:hypothetical protein